MSCVEAGAAAEVEDFWRVVVCVILCLGEPMLVEGFFTVPARLFINEEVVGACDFLERGLGWCVSHGLLYGRRIEPRMNGNKNKRKKRGKHPQITQISADYLRGKAKGKETANERE